MPSDKPSDRLATLRAEVNTIVAELNDKTGSRNNLLKLRNKADKGVEAINDFFSEAHEMVSDSGARPQFTDDLLQKLQDLQFRTMHDLNDEIVSVYDDAKDLLE